ncbi:MAG: hypothetical protein ACXWZF_13030, partial [Actinomycetota bacterium]
MRWHPATIAACVFLLGAGACADRAEVGGPTGVEAGSVDPEGCRRALQTLGTGAGPQPDAPAIAENLGVSVEDAELYLAAQDRIGKLQGRLLREGPSSFQGFAIDYEPDYLIEAWSTSGDRDELLAAFAGTPEAPVADCLVVVAVPYSERELGRALERVHRVVGDDIPFDASLDIRGGRVELFTADE